MNALLFLVATLVIPVAVGLPLVFCGWISSVLVPARIAVAWAGGTVILSVVFTVLTALGFAWNPWLVALIAVLSGVVALRIRAPHRGPGPAEPVGVGTPTLITALCVIVVACGGLLEFAAGAATSADLSYFWGVKALRFALDRGIDFQWLQQPHLIHLHPNYPPLWPVSLALGGLISCSFPWQVIPILTWIYLVATALVVHGLLRHPLGRGGATAVSCLWFAVLTGSTVRSFSGGSAEGPLLLFVTIAVSSLIIERRGSAPKFRWLAAGALGAAVFTKSEGVVATMLIITGFVIRELIWRRRSVIRNTFRLALPALGAVGLWAAVRIAYGLPLTDPIRETALQISFDHLEVILKVCLRLLFTDGLWVGWLAPLIAVSAIRPVHPERALPGLLLAAGLPIFAVAYYLHASGDPVELIVWTFPRLIQPALSAWIVCLGLLSFGGTADNRPANGDPPRGGS